ncbi:MAG: Hsp20/alpha crystallin family protein [Candidatus Hodarchaeaceae archaeon]|nr:Hsp20/alpha crystallin family protein [Candidatus Hodarchaeaceae archaeon]
MGLRLPAPAAHPSRPEALAHPVRTPVRAARGHLRRGRKAGGARRPARRAEGDVKLRAFGDSLELGAKRETPKEALLRERVDRFYRVVALPCAVRVEQVATKQENGVLKVTLPKAAGRAIEIA